MNQEKAYRIFRKNKAGNLVSAVMEGIASHRFFPNKETKPRRGWPNFTCFEKIGDAHTFYRQYCAYKASLKFEIWLVKIIYGKGHDYASVASIKRIGKSGLGCTTVGDAWPHGTIFAESITPIRRIDFEKNPLTEGEKMV